MFEDLQIIHYPDPRLRKVSTPVPAIDENLRQLVHRMFQLMRDDRGVGLAAPQVGVNLRVFIVNPTGKPEDDRVYVNPSLLDPSGEDDAEEGCLSLPDVRTQVIRARALRLRATDLDGNPFEEAADGYVARIWQHENDHLDGILLLDKMGPLEKLSHRKAIRAMEESWAAAHPASRRGK
jgi:peptide deformylase